jgi:hypothetical protein
MNTSGRNDVIAGIFGVIALAAGVVAFFWVPFLCAPLGLLCLLIAIVASPKYNGLYQLTAVLLVVGFVVGAAIAVATENPLY